MTDFITIKSIQDLLVSGAPNLFVDDNTSRRIWWCALEIIQKDFLSNYYQNGGIWVASPLPVIYETKYLNKLKGWLFSPEGFPYFKYDYAGYLPQIDSKMKGDNLDYFPKYKKLNLNTSDGYEPFLLIITSHFQCVLTISGEKNKKIVVMRCDHQSIQTVIDLVEKKFRQDNNFEAKEFRNSIQQMKEFRMNEEFLENFWPLLSIKLANLIPDLNFQTTVAEHNNPNNNNLKITEAKLLEAISHEVRTPLATIRTLISSTLKKYEMDEIIRNRLIQIDNECTEQIDRFGLIFNASELINNESSPSQQLASINLGEILKKLSPYWNNQLKRRGIALKIDIPHELPEILSNSEKLELMLGGLIDKNTRGLREGSILILELRPAGQKIKMQLFVHKKDANESLNKQDGSDIGPVLNWNPQTGSLQISQSAMHKLLASLGGHVTQRKDTGLTVFFPISERS